jgi:hypothetical protein
VDTLPPDAQRLLTLYAAKPRLATADVVRRLSWSLRRFDAANGELVIARKVENRNGWRLLVVADGNDWGKI